MLDGWTNPLPLSLGGGATDIEEIWRALRSAEGGERGPGPEGGDEDAARQVIATAIAGADRAIERAFFQAFPGLATDALALWEEALRSDGAASEVALRALLEMLWRPPGGATTPHLSQALLNISERLSIQIEDVDVTDVAVSGKYVAPEGNVPDYGDVSAARYPNRASRDVLRVVYELGAGETDIPEEIRLDVEKLLRRRLPTIMQWTLVQVVDASAPVFLLDGGDHGESLLDVTPFG